MARALAPLLRKDCVLILEIGIPLLIGYWSSVAADFSALLIFSAVTSAFVQLFCVFLVIQPMLAISLLVSHSGACYL